MSNEYKNVSPKERIDGPQVMNKEKILSGTVVASQEVNLDVIEAIVHEFDKYNYKKIDISTFLFSNRPCGEKGSAIVGMLTKQVNGLIQTLKEENGDVTEFNILIAANEKTIWPFRRFTELDGMCSTLCGHELDYKITPNLDMPGVIVVVVGTKVIQS